MECVFQRRQLLRTLSFAFGSSFLWSREQLASRRKQPHSRKSPLRLRGPLFIMESLEERKWKK